jgi:hypothetical protein
VKKFEMQQRRDQGQRRESPDRRHRRARIGPGAFPRDQELQDGAGQMPVPRNAVVSGMAIVQAKKRPVSSLSTKVWMPAMNTSTLATYSILRIATVTG